MSGWRHRNIKKFTIQKQKFLVDTEIINKQRPKNIIMELALVKKIILLIAALACASSCYAGSHTGKVKRIYARDDDLIYIVLEGTGSNKPNCASNPYWMIRDVNSTAGKAQLSIALAAQAQGKPVEIQGKHACTRWVDGEDIAYIMIGDN